MEIIHILTQKHELYDITDDVREVVKKSGI